MYPVMLNVQNRKCTVVGGGRTALRKSKKLAQYGAKVTVISPSFCDSFDFAEKIQSEYEPKHIENSFLVIAATDSREVNQRVAEDARKAGVLVSLVDDADGSDFVSPCSYTNGDITLAVSTNGKYPLLSKKLCEIKSADIDFYNDLLSLIDKYRQQILSKHGDTKTELLEYLISDEMIELATRDINTFKAKADELI